MKEKEIKLVIGALLHDIGKVIYRNGNDKRNHSVAGSDYLKDNKLIEDPEILDIVRYHHLKEIKNFQMNKDSPAFIVYMADNIAAACDRREKVDGESGFSIHSALEPIFNILNDNDKKMYYSSGRISSENEINYPTIEKKEISEADYAKIVSNISDNLKGLEWTEEYINSLLETLEANLAYIPSSTSQKELCDISLYDHLKLTAAFSSCIYAYVEEKQIDDLYDFFIRNGQGFYDREAFLLASLDISGIQSFIYTISTDNALKTLRARSFYLEILMEHMIDLFLDKMGLSRANLMYSGGGHCYMILPNTEKVKDEFSKVLSTINEWLMTNYDIALYLAGGYVECSSDALRNQPSGSYNGIYKKLSQILSDKKAARYNADQIRMLNKPKKVDYLRECRVCKRTGEVNESCRCTFCQKIEDFSANVLYSEAFSVISSEKEGLPLPGGYSLIAETEKTLKDRMNDSSIYVRAYGKNRMYSGKHISTKLWVGDYTTGKTFEQYAESAKGIERIAVLRADVDNLGQAIVSGLCGRIHGDKYLTISRTATFSRQLSMFFKLYINRILAEPKAFVYGDKEKRDCSIVYSGGDDIFLVGAWNDVLGAALDIRNELKRYSEETLTISAGLGVYESGYPINVIAYETAAAEDKSKNNTNKAGDIIKDSITLFENQTYTWDELETKVIGEKLTQIESFFKASQNNSGDYGKNYLYNLLELIRNQKEKINFARFVYILARMEPSEKKNQELMDAYSIFSQNMIKWIQDDSSRRELETAIILYVYLIREKEGEQSEYYQ